MSRVAVLSVPHTGTHTTFNILEALDHPRVVYKDGKEVGECKGKHFMQANHTLGQIQLTMDWGDKVIVPLRSPMMTYVSKYKRLLRALHKAPMQESLGYTLGNWYIMRQYLAQLVRRDALFVKMERSIVPVQQIAEYLGHEGDIPEDVAVGNSVGKEPSSEADVLQIEGMSYVAQCLQPAQAIYDEVLAYMEATYGAD